MTEITFITSNSTKVAHARHICREYDICILQYKKLFYGKGYKEPRIFDRQLLLEESIKDAISRWKKNVSNYGSRLFFIEDTSVRIDALSTEDNEVPGVDIKYWMEDNDFQTINKTLISLGDNRKASVSSHIILFLTDKIKQQLKSKSDYIIFTSKIHGTITTEEHTIETQILHPWLDNKSFNKWFIPDGYKMPISKLDINEADKVDFRRGAFEKMLDFLIQYDAVKSSHYHYTNLRLFFEPLFIITGPTCAGKTTVGKFMLENYDYYHIEASDFMSLKYFETHGTKFLIDKNKYAAEILKVNPLIVVDSIINYLKSTKLTDNLIITGFRSPEEIIGFTEKYPSNNMQTIFLDAQLDRRYTRWITRNRDKIKYSKENFIAINKLQDQMGLSKIRLLNIVKTFQNDYKSVKLFLNSFETEIIQKKPTFIKNSLDNLIADKINKISLETAILITLAKEYNIDENKYFTTTEISHLINGVFVELSKNKNNISRYFNQSFYPYYEIKKIDGKNKYKLSPTGYSEAIFLIQKMNNL